jgi:hypothetical protein
MIGLWLFHELIDDGFNAESAGAIAYEVARAARSNPNASTVICVSNYFLPSGDNAFPSEDVPSPSGWQGKTFSGSIIRKTMTFNIAYNRTLLARYTDEEHSIIGEDD